MFPFKKKKQTHIALEEHELLENAQRRISQRKRLYTHFVVFLIGSVFMVLINKVLKYGVDYDWFVWAILAWSFLFAIHAFNFFVTQRFMGVDWERRQRERLVALQRERISQIQKEIETEFPLSSVNKKKGE